MVTYCTSTQVAEFLQRADFSGTTSPTNTTVDNLIERNEKFIEQFTGHAWRTITVTDEFVDNPTRVAGLGYAFYLRHREVKQFTSGTDSINIFDGNFDIEYVANKTEGRAEDYFVDKTNGVVYIKDRSLFYPKGNRFTYRYGKSTVDGDIEKACILLTASDIKTQNDRAARFADDGPSNRLSHRDRVDLWKAEAMDILERKKEFLIV